MMMMMIDTLKLLAFALAVALPADPVPAAQSAPDPSDPMVTAAVDAATYVRSMLTQAAEQMSEEEYAYKPTPDVRSFGALLAHVADSNYSFCAAARGEKAPVTEVEKTRTGRDAIRQALAESFAYCDGAYAGLTEGRARALVDFMGGSRPVLAVLMFRTHHAALHYGNAITYLRLKGKLPPSSQRPSKK